MAWQELIEQTVTGLGYELVETVRTGGGLLRVTIDKPYAKPQATSSAQAADIVPGSEGLISAEDCEKVTRQLLFVLEVEGTDYSRLEVSSPGIDRLLRGEKDFERFTGEWVDITLKAPIGAASAGSGVAASRKKFRGVLERAAAQAGKAGWQIVWRDEPVAKPGQKISAKRALAPLQALGFDLDELQQARLAPMVNFKGRQTKPPQVNETND